MTKKALIKVINNNKGQAMVEFGLMLPLFVVIMMFLIISYHLTSDMITAQGDVRYDFRRSVDKMSEGQFAPIEENRRVSVEIPGKMKNALGMPFIRTSIKLKGYGGCYQGLKKNQYRRKYLYRRVR